MTTSKARATATSRTMNESGRTTNALPGYLGHIATMAVQPSRICYGTADMGTKADRDTSLALLDRYVALGGNFLDSAHVYASWLPTGAGASERMIGEWLRAHGSREGIVIGTKGAHPPLGNMAQSRLARGDIESDLTDSLERLGVDHIDIYYLHRDDPQRPVGEILEALNGFVSDGRIGCYAASNWTIERLEEANTWAAAHGISPFAASQPRFSLAETPWKEATGPAPTMTVYEPERLWHARTGLPVVAWSSQAGGYFGEANVAWARGGFVGDPPKAMGCDSPLSRRRFLAAIELAGQKGSTPNQIALAWMLHQPFPVYPIVGNLDLGRLEEAMGALRVSLTNEEVERLTTA